jgi:Glycosyl hydrolases family 2, sugar binding domain/Glycosyl hydrolases family 2, TIM barrel domain/Glycosyl hydrolases family 2
VPGQPSRKLTVPAPWQASGPGLRTYTGSACYRRRVQIPHEWTTGRIVLHFGAVDYLTSVAVNGTSVGEHEGGYLPFDFEIQDVAQAGTEAIIEVSVSDDMAPDVPKGKQSWYGPLAGIWQSVWLEAAGETYIHSMRVDADPLSGKVSVRPQLRGSAGDHSFHLVVRGPDGVEQQADELTVTVPNPSLWDLDTPTLYEMELSVLQNEAIVDTRVDTFGFRTVAARDGRILLNDRPLFLAGALDQDYYPETMCTPPSDAFLREQMRLAKELGLNCLRCHIKVPDPRYLYCADRAGILIWAELPSWETFSPEADRRARETLSGMIERDANHPSIIAWTIVNESWGVDLVNDLSQRAWLDEMVDFVRERDASRIVVDNSACRPNFHVRSDLNDFHFYTSIPDQREGWDAFLDEWTNEPASTYSHNGDERRGGSEPMVVSEFGNWGLPDPEGLFEEDGSRPWWFDTGQGWAGGVVHPEGILDRAVEWHLDKTFGGMRNLFRASQEHQFESIQYEVEQMRLRPEIAGFVITEFTDIYWECNGLLDLYRHPKAGHDDYRSIFGSDLPIAVPDRRRCFTGDEIRLKIHVAHASERDLSEATLLWRMTDGDEHGEQRISVPEWSAPAVTEVALRPTVGGRHRVEMQLIDGAGSTVARNWTDFSVFHRPSGEVAAWSGDPAVLDFLQECDWPIDRRIGVQIRRGLEVPANRALLFVAAGQKNAAIEAIARAGSPWEGDWAQGMHWLSETLRTDTPLLPRIDLTCSGLVPDAVLTGAGPEQTLAGMYVGWIHRSVATAAILGEGVVATTFPILEAGPKDPMALSLLGNLLRQCAR